MEILLWLQSNYLFVILITSVVNSWLQKNFISQEYKVIGCWLQTLFKTWIDGRLIDLEFIDSEINNPLAI